jgi:hypothetical protein
MGSRTAAKRWLRDRGYELVIPKRAGLLALHNLRLETFSLPHEVARTLDRSTGAMMVPIDKMMNRAAYPYGSHGWHPFVAALRQMLDEPALAYRQTVLASYYERFAPRSVHDFLLDGLDVRRSTLATWPAVNPLIDVWAVTEKHVQEFQGKMSDGSPLPHSQYRGPADEADGALHLTRCLDVHASLVEHGYRPAPGIERFITGYFLTRDDDWRFVVGHGNHRVPAMSVLGYTEIPVTFRQSHLPVVAEERLHRWTTAHGGLLEPDEVRAVFDRFFSDDSRNRATALGLR